MFQWLKQLFDRSKSARKRAHQERERRLAARGRARNLGEEATRLAKASLSQAPEKWLEAIEADPTWSVPYLNLAISYLDEGQFAKAEKYLNQAYQHGFESMIHGGNAFVQDEGLQVLQQVKAIRARISAEKEGKQKQQKDSQRRLKDAASEGYTRRGRA